MAVTTQWSDLSKAHKIAFIISAFLIAAIIGIAVFSQTLLRNNDSTNVTNAQVADTTDRSLAQRVEKTYLSAWGISDISQLVSLQGASVATKSITKFEYVSSGTIRIYVQSDLSEDDAKALGRQVFGLVGDANSDLQFIVIRGVNGQDVNMYRPER